MAMKVEWVSRTRLKPYPNNPRNNDDAVDAVAASLSEFGWQQPIVIDKDFVIIAGHTRLKAAEKLGMNKVPVVVAKDLTNEQVKAYRLADNKTAELAGWNFELLDVELADISGDIDMEALGFFLPNAEDFGEEFSLPDGEKESIVYHFTFHQEQWDAISQAMEAADMDPNDAAARGAFAWQLCQEVGA